MSIKSSRDVPVLLASPHRLLFLGGIIQFPATMALWLLILAGWYITGMSSPSLTIGGLAAHAFFMLYGIFPFFVFGFALTAFPRWISGDAVTTPRYTLVASLLIAGTLLSYLGFFMQPMLAGIGALLIAAGWAVGVYTLAAIWYRAAPGKDKRFALFPLACMTAGNLGALLFALWLLRPDWSLMAVSIDTGLWLFLVPLIVAVSYRMLPFFSSRVLSHYTIVKPGWTLPVTMLLVVLHWLLSVSGLPAWLFAADLPLAVLALWHTRQWQLWRSLSVPLLGMLHIAFAWLGIAMLMYALDSLLLLFSVNGSLGTAPLHALGIGYIASMTVAMASRVSLGHSGRPLVAGPIALWAFALLQLVTVVRIVSDLPWLAPHRPTGLLLAGLLWLMALLPWAARFAGLVSLPRADGKAG